MNLLKFDKVHNFPEKLIERLLSADSCVVLTGAGVSAESGVPTFRDAVNGTWSRFNVEEFGTPDAFKRDPKKVWEWYEYRRMQASDIKPNPGHYAFAQLEKIFPEFWLITQNVDGLHKKAGSKNILALHGDIYKNKCFEEDIYIEDLPESDEKPPRCPNCGGYIRPAVVWFHEPLPEQEIKKAIEKTSDCDVFIVAGTSAVVYPAAELPIIAKRNGAYVIEVNLEQTPISDQLDITILGKTGEVMPELVRTLEGIRSQRYSC